MMKENLQDTKNAATKYIKNSVGATDKIWEVVKNNF